MSCCPQVGDGVGSGPVLAGAARGRPQPNAGCARMGGLLGGAGAGCEGHRRLPASTLAGEDLVEGVGGQETVGVLLEGFVVGGVEPGCGRLVEGSELLVK